VRGFGSVTGRKLVLYHRLGAGRPPRVRWALEEIGAPYELVVMTREEAGEAPHLDRHPRGKVPVLESENGYLWESVGLCLQVADLFPEAGLIPAPGSHERGLVYQWSVFAMTELEPAILRLYVGLRDGFDAGGQAAAEATAKPFFDVVERGLGSSDYLVGDRFTVADVVVGGVIEVADRIDAIPAGPVDDYFRRLSSRPAYQRAIPRTRGHALPIVP
jgi:glutathione S-transferase